MLDRLALVLRWLRALCRLRGNLALENLREVRDEKERLQKLVEDSEGVEQQLRELTSKRGQREEAVASAIERVKTLEQLAAEAAVLSAAAEQRRIAREEVERIQGIDRDVQAAERNVKDLAIKVAEGEEALKTAQSRLDDTKVALDAAEKAATADGSYSSTRDTVARQALELRQIAAEHAGREAQRRIDAALAAQKLVDVAATAASEHQKQQAEAEAARTALGDAAAKDKDASEQLRRMDLLERALETRVAGEQAATARTSVEQAVSLRARLESEARERDGLATRRAAITIPPASSLGPMRRLANDLAGARGALNVGFIVTVFNGMAMKLMEAVFAERTVLEKELVDLLPTLSTEDGTVTGDERAMLYGGWPLDQVDKGAV